MPWIHELPKKQFWIVNTTLIAFAAFLNAQAIMNLVGISIGPEAVALAAPRHVAEKGTPDPSRRSADALIRRNPFDHTTSLETPPPPEPSTPDDVLTAPRCDGLKVLVIAASGDPEWSLAAFRSADGKSVLRRRGGEVNGMHVRFVGAERVWLESDGRLCQTSPFDRGEPQAKPAASLSPKGVQQVGPKDYDVDRALVERLVENPADLLRQARLGNGIRFVGIRPNTLLAALGLQNGDRLETVNGFDLSDPQKALEAFARLRTADALSLVVERQSQLVTLDYRIK